MTEYFECNRCGNCCPQEGKEETMGVPFTAGDFYRFNRLARKGEAAYPDVVMSEYFDLTAMSPDGIMFMGDVGEINVAMPMITKECMFYDTENNECNAFGGPLRYINCLPNPDMDILTKPAREGYFDKGKGKFFRCAEGKVIRPGERKRTATISAISHAEVALTMLLSPFVPKDTENHVLNPHNRGQFGSHFHVQYYLNEERRSIVTDFLGRTSELYGSLIGFDMDLGGYEEPIPEVDTTGADHSFHPRQKELIGELIEGFNRKLMEIACNDF